MPLFNHVTTHKDSLAALFFGKSCFLGSDVFGTGATLCNENISLARFAPRFEYTEYGIMIGFHGFRTLGCDDRWRVGMRVQLPIEVVNVDLTNSGDFETHITPTPTPSDLGNKVRYSFADINPSNTFRLFPANAYRFDLLNTLKAPNGTPLMTYTATDVFVSMQKIDVVNPINATSHILKKTNESIDVEVDTIYQQSSGATPPLPPSGSPTVNNVRYYFAQGFDYSAVKADPTLFLVPSSGQQTVGLDESLLVENIIDQAIQDAELAAEAAETICCTTIEQVFRDCCVTFDSQRTVGIGDLRIDLYGGYHADDWYVDLMLDTRFPSGGQNDNPRRALFQTIGNNGHFEIGPHVEAGWNPCDWIAATLGVAYNRALKATEKRSAPFAGATVVNIGRAVDVNVSWGYVFGHFDMTFFHPRNKNLGTTFGYELYAKQNDKVKICGARTKAIDCCGNFLALNTCLLENNTNTQTHKLRGTVFHRIRCWELFAGASLIVAGRNAMQEAEWLLGINVYF
jgi:hypothetical protein